MDEMRIAPVVSVIIPCYNLGKYLEETLSSVLNQTYAGWECILVDNSSSDNTKEVANKFVKKDDRFKYYLKENYGVSSARNFAIKNSSGKYILPLDSDDKIGQDYMKDAIEILVKDPGIKVVYSEAELFGEVKGKWELPDFSMEKMLVQNLIFCSAFFRRSDYDKTRGYNEQMLTGFEDWDFWLEMLKNGGKVYRIPAVHFYYRIRKSSRNNSLDADKQRLLRRLVYENHKDLYTKYINIPDLIFELYQCKEKEEEIYNSRDYKTGNILLKPLRKLINLFKFRS